MASKGPLPQDSVPEEDGQLHIKSAQQQHDFSYQNGIAIGFRQLWTMLKRNTILQVRSLGYPHWSIDPGYSDHPHIQKKTCASSLNRHTGPLALTIYLAHPCTTSILDPLPPIDLCTDFAGPNPVPVPALGPPEG